MILMRRVIYNINGNFLLVLLCVVFTLAPTKAMHAGRWMRDHEVIDAARLAAYVDSPSLAVDGGAGRNTAVVEDVVSHQMIIISSGMFPFSTIPDPQFTELIDYIFPAQAAKAKNLNIILSNLSQIQARPNANPVDEVKGWAQSVLIIIEAMPAVLEGTGIDVGEDIFIGKLHDMVVDGRKKGLAAYLKKIKPDF